MFVILWVSTGLMSGQLAEHPAVPAPILHPQVITDAWERGTVDSNLAPAPVTEPEHIVLTQIAGERIPMVLAGKMVVVVLRNIHRVFGVRAHGSSGSS